MKIIIHNHKVSSKLIIIIIIFFFFGETRPKVWAIIKNWKTNTERKTNEHLAQPGG